MTRKMSAFLIAVVLVLALGAYWALKAYNTEQHAAAKQATASLEKGIALFHVKKYGESIKELQSVPDDVLRDWRLGYYTASSMVMLKDFQAAIPELEKALEMNPGETLVLFELGVVYFKLGNLGMSKAYFAAVVDIDPTNAEARGLMDIMADLERRQPASTAPVENTDNQPPQLK